MSSSSEESSNDERGFLFPSLNPGVGEFEHNPRKRKRRRTGRDAKESAALGVFGSESDDDGPNKSWRQKTLRSRGVGFIQSHDQQPEELDQTKLPELSVGPGYGARTEGAVTEHDEVEAWATAEAEFGIPGRAFAKAFRSTTMGLGRQDEHLQEIPLPSQPATIPLPDREFTATVETEEIPRAAEGLRSSHFFGADGQGSSFANGYARKADGAQPRKTAAAGTKSFGAKMLSKMGYVEGAGLGSQGQGIVNPIEQKLRPMGAGLGVVREKTQQAKEEEKKKVEARGERYIDSSEEERRRKKERRANGKGTNQARTGPAVSRPKTQYRTAGEIAASAKGLEVPSILTKLIDATGRETRTLNSTHGLMTPPPGRPVAQTEERKLAERARRDLEAYAREWTSLTDRQTLAVASAKALETEIAQINVQVEKLTGLMDSVMALQYEQQAQDDTMHTQDGIIAEWSGLAQRLEALSMALWEQAEPIYYADIVVSLATPLLKLTMDSWEGIEPCAALTVAAVVLRQFAPVLHPRAIPHQSSVAIINDPEQGPRPRKTTTSYETMMYTIWLPKLRSMVAEMKNLYQPLHIIGVLDEWREIIPDFVLSVLVNQVIIPRLIQDLQKWNPGSNSKRNKRIPPPHMWIFPWLQYISEEQMDVNHSHSLLGEVRRKLRKLLDVHDLEAGVPEGLHQWQEVMAGELEMVLIRHLLPRLSRYLATNLRIDPFGQSLHELEVVFRWNSFLKPAYLAQLLLAQFFPRWQATLRTWLSMEQATHHEIDQWFDWWSGHGRTVLPQAILQEDIVKHQLETGLVVMHQVMCGASESSGKDWSADMKTPEQDEGSLPADAADLRSVEEQEVAHDDYEFTIRDVLDHLCAEENLRQVALQEADPSTGSPLWRLTASASGRGGIIIRIESDAIYVRDKERGDGWRPVDPRTLVNLIST